MSSWPADELTVRKKIGIGTDTPTENLDVKGNIKLNSGVAVGEFSSDVTLATASHQSVPTTQTVKTYVDNQVTTVSMALATKADRGGSNTQDFQANNLKVQGNLEVTGTTTFRNIEQHQGDVELGNEDTDRTIIRGVLESSHPSGYLQINSPVSITSGNVGIGTNDSLEAKLTVYSTTQSTGNNTAVFRAPNIGPNQSHIHWGTTGDWYIRSAKSSGIVVLQDTGGNVGIGTAAPRDRLDVAGNFRLLTDTNPIRFTSSWSGFPDSTTNQAEICNDTGTFQTLMIVGNRSAGLLGGFGRRVSIWDQLEVNGITKMQKLALGDKWLLSGLGDAHANDEWLRLFNNQGTGYFGGLAAEKLWSSTGTVSSDIRLKRDISELTQPLTKLLQLRGVSYYWQDVRKGTTSQLGLIAQEVETVFPELVEQGADGMKALNYNGLIPVLLEALKEQQSTITSLIDRLNAVEAKQASKV